MFISSLNIGPAKLYLFIMLLWLTFFLTSPIYYEIEFTVYNLVVFLLIQTLLLSGFYVGQQFSNKKNIVNSFQQLHIVLNKNILPLILFVGILGFFLKLYVLFFIKGVPLTINPLIIRYALLNEIGAGQGGGLSVLAGLFFPFCLLYIPIYFALEDKSRRSKLGFVVIILVLLIEAGLNGGGTSITITFLFFVFSTKGGTLSNLAKLSLVLGIVLVVFICSYFWLERLDSMFGGVQYYLKEFNNNWIAKYSTDFVNHYEPSSFISNVYYIYSWLSYYFTHGYIEFFHLLNNFDTTNHSFGIYQSYLFFKLFSIIGFDVPSPQQLSELNIVQGHYQTFWGMAYIDFGYFFLIEVFVVGFLSSYLYVAKLRGTFSGVIFYPYIQTQIIYSFLSNPLNGQVTYIIFSGLLLLLVLKIVKYKKLN